MTDYSRPDAVHWGQHCPGRLWATVPGLHVCRGQATAEHVTSPFQHVQWEQGSGYQSVLCCKVQLSLVNQRRQLPSTHINQGRQLQNSLYQGRQLPKFGETTKHYTIKVTWRISYSIRVCCISYVPLHFIKDLVLATKLLGMYMGVSFVKYK